MVAIISVSVGRRINFGPFAANYKRNQQDKEVKSMTRIDIISGFLGAGKTTLIKKLLGDALKGQQVVLIENEFGEIGIDGGFLKDAGGGDHGFGGLDVSLCFISVVAHCNILCISRHRCDRRYLRGMFRRRLWNI